MRMTWDNLLFIHWPVAADALRSIVPNCLEIDTFDGRAWVGLIPFTMRGVRHPRLPGVPTATDFHECNVRTYVVRDREPGVWFFSLDAASRLAVWGARLLWSLNYLYARMSLECKGDVIEYAVDRRYKPRAAMRCRWRIGEPLPRSRPGELAHFLTDRYMLYAVNGRGEPSRGRIWHEPWPLRSAELLDLDDSLVASAGIDLTNAPPPVLHYADRVDVEAWFPERA